MADGLRAGRDTGATSQVIRSYPRPAVEGPWRAFLRTTKDASHFVSPQYFLEDFSEESSKGLLPFGLLVTHGKEVIAALTGWRNRGKTVSGAPHRPQVLLAPGHLRQVAEEALLRGLATRELASPVVTVYSWQPLARFMAAGYKLFPVDRTYVLDLAPPEEEIFRRFSASKRRYCGSWAARHGIEISNKVSDGEWKQVLEVFNETQARHRITLWDRGDLERLRRSANRAIFVARREDRVIAATIIRFLSGGLAEYSENASLKALRSLHPNEPLMWAAIRWSRTQGCTRFSFGGHTSFKEGFGGSLESVLRLRRDLTIGHRVERTETLANGTRGVLRAIRARWRAVRSRSRH
jgi:hypothetical protein